METTSDNVIRLTEHETEILTKALVEAREGVNLEKDREQSALPPLPRKGSVKQSHNTVYIY